EVMDQMEARMVEDQQQVQRDLEALAARPDLAPRPELARAQAAWQDVLALKARILKLSREHTGVLSRAMSLERLRPVQLACQSILEALRMDWEAEPVAGLQPEKPR